MSSIAALLFQVVFIVGLVLGCLLLALCLWDGAVWLWQKLQHALWLRQCERIVANAECEQLNRLLDGQHITPRQIRDLEQQVDSVEALMRREQRP